MERLIVTKAFFYFAQTQSLHYFRQNGATLNCFFFFFLFFCFVLFVFLFVFFVVFFFFCFFFFVNVSIVQYENGK